MKAFEAIIKVLQTTMEEPKAGGAMHLTALGVTIVLAVLLCIFFRNSDNKTFRIILTCIWAVMFVMEVLKQVSTSCVIAPDGTISWHYNWSHFTFQLCDTPIYLLLPVAFLPDGKVRSALSTYMATYILLGGMATYLFPASIYSTSLYCNVHSLVHHGLQIASCSFIGVHNRKDLTLYNFLLAFIIFLAADAAAVLFNVGLHFWHPEQHVNMFFISPYEIKHVPDFLYDGWKALGWGGRLALYVVGVSALAFGIFWAYRGFIALSRRIQKKKADQTAA